MAILCAWGVWSLLLGCLCIRCVSTVDATTDQDRLHPCLDFKKYTIVTPRLFHGREKTEISTTRSEGGKEHLQDLIIHINISGEQQILELHLNRELLPGGYFQRHQENGKHIIHRPTKEEVDLCQYQGNLRGVPSSWAAVSTCNGLRGVVFDGHELHYLEPREAQKTNNFGAQRQLGEVYHYRHSDLRKKNYSCGYEGTPQNVMNNKHFTHLLRSKRDSPDYERKAIRGPFNATNKTRYVELVLVVDRKLYSELGSSKEIVHQRCKDIANIVNALYIPLNIFVALVGIVVWTQKDEILLSSNGDATLTDFLRYRREKLVKEHPNDHAQLLTRVEWEKSIGKALRGKMCTFESSGGAIVDYSHVVALVAATVAHEMGHNFGMEDDTTECSCPHEPCIMAPVLNTVSPTRWSSCSEKYLLTAFDHGVDYCLQNKPTKYGLTIHYSTGGSSEEQEEGRGPDMARFNCDSRAFCFRYILFGSPVCGNGFVEDGEQCDCGLGVHCTNPCCNATTCMLQPNASCATGECCDLETCRPKAAGTVCRSADQECDLPEFCTGKNEYCKEDVFKLDGETCSNGEAFCYHGLCRTRSDQCKLLWGPSGDNGDSKCYEKNTVGDINGHCGFNKLNKSFAQCGRDNIDCGALQCKTRNEELSFKEDSSQGESHSFIRTGNGSIERCYTASVDLGLNVVDPGLVPDGSKCGEGKMCLNQNCTAVSLLRHRSSVDACPQNCSGNGVCNSRGNCHCDAGFAPPFCDSPGTGGSEDSGPAPDPDAGRKYDVDLYIFFLGIVLSTAIVALAIHIARRLVKHCWEKPGSMASQEACSSEMPSSRHSGQRYGKTDEIFAQRVAFWTVGQEKPLSRV